MAVYRGRDGYLFYNDAWRPILGDKHPWALGRAAREVWPEIWDVIAPLFDNVFISGAIEDIMIRLSRGEKLHDYPARLRCKDGSIRDVLIDSSVYFEGGKFIHTRCFTRDITERRQAEEALRRHADELTRFNRAAVGRELRMIELKKEVNDLCERLGQAPRYPLEFDRDRRN